MGVQTHLADCQPEKRRGGGVLHMMAHKERLHTQLVLFKPQVHPVMIGISRELTHLIQLYHFHLPVVSTS